MDSKAGFLFPLFLEFGKPGQFLFQNLLLGNGNSSKLISHCLWFKMYISTAVLDKKVVLMFFLGFLLLRNNYLRLAEMLKFL